MYILVSYKYIYYKYSCVYHNLSVRVGQSTHENYVCVFFYNEHERMARVELDGLDVARTVICVISVSVFKDVA